MFDLIPCQVTDLPLSTIVPVLSMLVFVTLHYFVCSVKRVAYLFQKDDSSDSTPCSLTFIFGINSTEAQSDIISGLKSRGYGFTTIE